MAKYAFLSDIHSNLEALTVVLQKCKEEDVEFYVSLGDIVGYNANPKECLKLVRDLNPIAMVKGNHDEYSGLGNFENSGFNQHAKAAVKWTSEQLDASERAWLVSPPYRDKIQSCSATIVHATLDSPESWGYIFDMHHATDSFQYQFTQMGFCGHSHVPITFCRRPITAGNEQRVIVLQDWTHNEENPEADTNFLIADELQVELRVGAKYLFNIGSIGQPRNKDPRASFAILNTDNNTVTRYRLPYDIQLAQEKVLAAGLPERLANRLSFGV